jgi:hypothetical protein
MLLLRPIRDFLVGIAQSIDTLIIVLDRQISALIQYGNRVADIISRRIELVFCSDDAFKLWHLDIVLYQKFQQESRCARGKPVVAELPVMKRIKHTIGIIDIGAMGVKR